MIHKLRSCWFFLHLFIELHYSLDGDNGFFVGEWAIHDTGISYRIITVCDDTKYILMTVVPSSLLSNTRSRSHSMPVLRYVRPPLRSLPLVMVGVGAVVAHSFSAYSPAAVGLART